MPTIAPSLFRDPAALLTVRDVLRLGRGRWMAFKLSHTGR